jgi:hypothetical protein
MYVQVCSTPLYSGLAPAGQGQACGMAFFFGPRGQHVRLAWRKSRGVRRSLGWVPFKVRTIRYRAGQLYFAGRWLSLWDSFGLKDFELRAGNFSEDARGRWYMNVCVPAAHRFRASALTWA